MAWWTEVERWWHDVGGCGEERQWVGGGGGSGSKGNGKIRTMAK